MLPTKAFQILLLAAVTTAAAIPAQSFILSDFKLNRRSATAESQLLSIAPTSNTCSGASFVDECETATQAAPFLIAAMQTYSITTTPEMAALLSLIAFETGDFKFSKNHFPAPGRPGQGTRNMQMAAFNLQYAQSIPALASPLAAITTATTADRLTDDQLNAIRALVLADKYAWGSAAWFYTTQCSSDVRAQVKAGEQAGYTAYLGCVGTTATDDRLAYWTRANAAFGLA